jgi:hypothetical protein
LLPTHGAVGFLLRLAAVAAVAPGLWIVGFAHPAELRQARALVARVRPAGSGA